MKTLKRIAVIALVATIMVLCSLTALAQATNAAPAGGGSVPAPTDLTTLWTALIAVVVPLAVAFLKKVIPKIPSALLPIGAAALGVLSDFLLAKAGAFPHTSLALGALTGLAGVGVREVVDQLKQTSIGPTPPPSISATTGN